jgi:class 3 adenylate cyclase/tetratricopeptide (TPR) repeat protein
MVVHVEIGAWLRDLDLQQYERVFRENAIDSEALAELTDADLEKLGILLGHRKRILRAITASHPKISVNDLVSSDAATVPARTRGAERRQITVMFCDLIGSTALSSRLDPEDLREVLGVYNALVAETVGRFGGTVSRYMGDGVLSLFGHPQAHEDDAERAIRAGLLLADRISQLKFGSVRLEVRVGVATGQVVVGELIGTGNVPEHGVVGETPNLAYRLQAFASPNAVLISESTRRLVGNLFEYRDLGLVEIKGFADRLPVRQVLRPGAVDGRFEALRGSSLTPLVGREEELALLLRLWERVKAGEGQIVQLSGEAGIGKSRVADALQGRLLGEPNIRLRYFCSPHHSGSPLYPVIANLERAAAFAREDTNDTKFVKLQTLLTNAAGNQPDAVALFAELLGLPTDGKHPPIPLDPQLRRELVLAASIRYLEGLARRQPVLLMFEDAHWIDSTSLELLNVIAERAPHIPVLLLVTARSEFEPPWAGCRHFSNIALSPLDRRESGALVAHVAGDKPLPGEILDRIVDRTDGIPLFVEELTKTVLEGGYSLDRAVPQLEIPTSLHDSLMARLDRLSSVKDVAQIGAALGRQFSYELLAAVSPHNPEELQDALNKLTTAGLISCRGVPPWASITFKHALIQNAAYSTLLRSQRQELHARISSTLEERFPETVTAQPEILAHHYTQAGRLDTAIDYWLKAGERALRRSANVEAVAHLTQGIELARALLDSPERDHHELRLHLALGPAMRAINGHATEEVLAVYSRARELLNDSATIREQISVLYGLWIAHFTRWDTATHQLAQEIIAVSERRHDIEAKTLGNALMGNTHWGTGEFVAARSHLELSLNICDSGEKDSANSRTSHNHSVAVLSFLGVTLWPLGFLEQAADAAERALDRARRTGHVPLTAMALHNEAFLVASFGIDQHLIGIDPAEAEKYCHDHGVAAYEPWARFWQGVIVARDNPRNGIARMREAMEAAEKIGANLFRSVQLGHLGTAYASLGQPETGIALLDRAIRIAKATRAGYFLAELHRFRGDLLGELGRDGEAEAELQRSLMVSREQRARLWELRAATSLAGRWLDKGRGAEARDLLAPVYRWFTEGHDTADLNTARLLLDDIAAECVHAEVTAAVGSTDNDIEGGDLSKSVPTARQKATLPRQSRSRSRLYPPARRPVAE